MSFNVPNEIFLSILEGNVASVSLRVERHLREREPSESFVATQHLDLHEYVRLGHATATLCEIPFPSQTATWGGLDHDLLQIQYEQALWSVVWRNQHLHVLQVSWSTDCGTVRKFWVIAQEESVAREFILDAARKTNDPGETVLVFQNGRWNRSSEMFQTIQSTSMDDLVLPGERRKEMIADFHRFLQSRSQYESLGLAWRRGAILIGPPGNGKTHFLRALVHELVVPCLYVQSLEHHYYEAEQLLDMVFERARQVRPCVLIFEDLDSLIDDDNRSYFLNQLDGFEKNIGLIVVATTNHAERIDAAILDRPSRFDRKYEFPLPEIENRHRFLELWKDKLNATVNWDGGNIPELAAATDGFSYAYLKELVVSALLQWVHSDSPSNQLDSFENTLIEQVRLLQEQRKTSQAYLKKRRAKASVSV